MKSKGNEDSKFWLLKYPRVSKVVFRQLWKKNITKRNFSSSHITHTEYEHLEEKKLITICQLPIWTLNKPLFWLTKWRKKTLRSISPAPSISRHVFQVSGPAAIRSIPFASVSMNLISLSTCAAQAWNFERHRRHAPCIPDFAHHTRIYRAASENCKRLFGRERRCAWRREKSWVSKRGGGDWRQWTLDRSLFSFLREDCIVYISVEFCRKKVGKWENCRQVGEINVLNCMHVGSEPLSC